MRVGLGIGISVLGGVPWVPDAPTLTAPADNSDVYDGVAVTVSATVTAGQVPDRIDFVLDPGVSEVVVATDSASPYSQSWTPTGVTPGAHTLVARFVYGSGSVDSTAIDIVLFDPSVIAGLVLWLSADVGVTEVSGKVSQWDDQSGLGHHVTQGTAGNRPVLNASAGPGGGKAIVFSEAGTSWLATTAAFGEQPATVAALCKSTSSGSMQRRIADDGTTVNTRLMYVPTSSANTLKLNAGAEIANTNWSADTWHAHVAVFSGASSVNRIDATETTGNPGTGGSAGGIIIGASIGGGHYWDGPVKCVAMYAGAVSAGNRDRLVAYMNALT